MYLPNKGSLAEATCHADSERLLHPNKTRSMAITPSRQQVACDETEEPLTPLSFPTLPISLQPQIGKVSAACSCCQMHSHWTVDGLDWTVRCRACYPQGLVDYGSTPWRTCYKVATSLVGARYYCELVFDVLKYS